MLISHEHRFIFFACGKTGTTSIEAALAKYDEGDSIRRELADDLRSSGKILKLNAASRDAVYRAYWKDIEALGYEF